MSPRTLLILTFSLFVIGLLWGGYTLLFYVGVPIHQLVYLQTPEVQHLDQLCGTDQSISTILCRGTSGLWWFFTAVFYVGSPFLPYVFISLLVYGGYLFWKGYSTGVFQAHVRLRPMSLILFFLVAVWLIGTTLSVTSLYNSNTPNGQRMADTTGQTILPPFSRFYEPDASVFNGISPQALAELKTNYQQLLDRGCLNPVTNNLGQELSTSSGARVFDLSFWCMQQSMFSRVGLQVVMLLLFLLNLLVLGRAMLSGVLRLRPVHPLLHLCLSFGMGALLFVAILWTAAVLKILSGTVATVIFFGIPLVLFPWTKQWIHEALTPSISADIHWKNPTIILLWLLLSYLALNFLNVVRPFPIGWDDLGSYLNRPRLLASYGYFIPSMAQFQWEYLTSLGFLIFGYDNPVGSTFAMQINWAAGLLAVIVAYAFGRLFLGKGRGLLTAILYYFLPMTGHFSFADMKVDNASFFTSVLAILAVFVVCCKSDEHDENAVAGPDWKLLLVAGMMAGFSFAIKATAVLTVFMCLSILAGVSLGWYGFGTFLFGGFLILAQYGPLNIADIAHRSGLVAPISSTMFAIILALLALGLGAWATVRQRKLMLPFLRNAGAFVLGIALSCIVWAGHNLAINRTPSVGSLLTATDRTAPQVFYRQKEDVEAMKLDAITPVRFLPPELKLDPKHPACQGSARTEELDRYWGFDRDLSHYLTLPWRQVMNSDAFGYYVTLMPALLLFPLLFLLPFFWSKEARWLRFLVAGTLVFIVQWALVANGVIWYGIGMFLGLCVGLEAFIAYAPDRQNRILFSTLIFFSILVCLVNRFWQFDTQKNIFEYPLGKVTANALREVTIPEYDDIRQVVVARHEGLPDTPYTYRIGTFISYFIPKNREIFPLADHQMSFFNCLNQELDHPRTLQRLKALGFNSIIFDTNTHTIEKDPNGSLHKKVEAFLAFVNDPALKLQIVVNDPGNGIAFILLP